MSCSPTPLGSGVTMFAVAFRRNELNLRSAPQRNLPTPSANRHGRRPLRGHPVHRHSPAINRHPPSGELSEHTRGSTQANLHAAPRARTITTAAAPTAWPNHCPSLTTHTREVCSTTGEALKWFNRESLRALSRSRAGYWLPIPLLHLTGYRAVAASKTLQAIPAVVAQGRRATRKTSRPVGVEVTTWPARSGASQRAWGAGDRRTHIGRQSSPALGSTLVSTSLQSSRRSMGGRLPIEGGRISR